MFTKNFTFGLYIPRDNVHHDPIIKLYTYFVIYIPVVYPERCVELTSTLCYCVHKQLLQTECWTDMSNHISPVTFGQQSSKVLCIQRPHSFLFICILSTYSHHLKDKQITENTIYFIFTSECSYFKH